MACKGKIKTGCWIIALLIGCQSTWAMAESDSDRILDSLSRVIEEGRRSKAARPDFLDKLKKIVDGARRVTGKLLLAETFDAGNQERDPRWKVLAGHFEVDGSGALFSSANRSEVLSLQAGGEMSDLNEQPAEKISDDRLVRGIVGVMRGKTSGDHPNPGAGGRYSQGTAMIRASVSVPDNFRLRVTFRSDLAQGEGEVGLVVGQDVQTGYHLRLFAAPDRNKTLQIVRYDEEHRMQSIAVMPGHGLGDGLNHGVVWQRSGDGHMKVWLDGQAVLQVQDVAALRGLDGLLLVNHKGDIAFDNIELYGE
ncbi:MAG: hypothetical protein HQL77_09030 [Magnetococcales bacterium]|nr:hypothetical protein [Magnetococcales bacterium]